MTLIVGFIDGFTSATSPNVQGAQVSIYDLDNNISSATSLGTLVDLDDHTSLHIDYELSRSVTGTPYRQVGKMMAYYDGTDYKLSFGNYDGSDLLTESTPTGEKVRLTVAPTFGNAFLLLYETGDLVGSGHQCKLKLSITRIRVS